MEARTMSKSTSLLSVLSLAALLASGCIFQSAQAQPGSGGEGALPPSGSVSAVPASGAPASQTLSWPRVYQEGAVTLTLYQPQVEQWDDTTMTFRAAIALQSAPDAEPVYGVVRTTARADVDKAARLVTLQNFQIVKVSFPSAPGINDSAREILLKHLPAGAKTISLDRIEPSLAVSQAVKKQRALGVKNDPPRILFAATPALLMLVDGDPVLRPMSVPGAQRVINTQALIVNVGGSFYLTALNYWYVAPAVEGPWAPVDNPPEILAQIKQAAIATNLVDLIQPEVGAAPPAAPPAVFVSTVPAELIQTDGSPQMVPIEGTDLYQAQNSDDPIFLDGDSGAFYVLISGRWFRSRSLQTGPWAFVPAANLPPDFAKIPQDNPRANVLVSVPGTPEAKEALIANSIPQTATVTCGPGNVDLDYDGAPQFEPIEGTDLGYAPNATLPVIQCAPDSYYCVQNGIWFFAPTPAGPWTVATVVPTAIYGIPVSCPVQYVTYVCVYGWTGNTVCVGYTPGYLGTVVSEDGVVVFGTGYYHRCHIGAEWIGFPCTYGCHAGFACGPDTSFAFGFSAGIFDIGGCHPWWGPYRWGWQHDVNYSHISLNHINLYAHWHGLAVSIPRRSEAVRVEEKGRVREPERFNPYSARSRAPARGVNVAIRPQTLLTVPRAALKPAARDWSANAGPRPMATARTTAPTGLPAPVPQRLQNNVFTGANDQVYRLAPTVPRSESSPEPRPASEPIILPPGRQEPEVIARPPAPEFERSAPRPQPSQPVQWEQRTENSWQPAAQSPSFQREAPQLNQEAAARQMGEMRAGSAREIAPPAFSAPITPSFRAEPSAPTMGGGRGR